MTGSRAIEIEVGANEDFVSTFARDQLMLLRCARDGSARARVWRRRDAGLLLGRFHRADPASCLPPPKSGTGTDFLHALSSAPEIGSKSGTGTDFPRASAPAPGFGPGKSVPVPFGGLSRRLSGGRIVVVGPGVVCITMAAPLVDWFDGAGGSLRPDQVLNRALRPLLAMLRGQGIDAFYPGRDLVTAGGRAIAHASFTVMRDGVAVVEMHVAEAPAFADLPALLDRFDPAGVAGVDRNALAGATSLAETATAARSDEEWAASFAQFAAAGFACEAAVTDATPGDDITLAHDSAARDFLLSPGPVEQGALSAAAVSMLGVVECSARMRGDRVTGLRVTGDLIAPFHTLDDVAAECEGEPFRAANIRKALARAMAKPRSFVLGLRELDELILRIC